MATIMLYSRPPARLLAVAMAALCIALAAAPRAITAVSPLPPSLAKVCGTLDNTTIDSKILHDVCKENDVGESTPSLVDVDEVDAVLYNYWQKSGSFAFAKEAKTALRDDLRKDLIVSMCARLRTAAQEDGADDEDGNDDDDDDDDNDDEDDDGDESPQLPSIDAKLCRDIALNISKRLRQAPATLVERCEQLCRGNNKDCSSFQGAGSTDLLRSSIDRASPSVLARACTLAKQEKLQHADECIWDASCLDAIVRTASELELDEALPAAFAGLETGNLSAATPVAVATACVLEEKEFLLEKACQRSKPPCSRERSWTDYYHLDSRCSELFSKGESKFKVLVDVKKDYFSKKVWELRQHEVRVGTYKDCCDMISSECRCELGKRMIKEGKVPTVGCLDPKKLKACKP